MDDSEPGIVYQPLVELIEEQEDELAPERLSIPKSCVVILIIEIISLLVNVTLCISGNIAGPDGRIWLVFLVIINLAVLILLANGLFGREFRLSSLPIVVGLKAFSTIYWTKVFVFVIFDVDFMKEWLLQFVHSIPLDFDLMTLQMCIAAVVFFVASYHAFAAWMVYRYYRLLKQEEIYS